MNFDNCLFSYEYLIETYFKFEIKFLISLGKLCSYNFKRKSSTIRGHNSLWHKSQTHCINYLNYFDKVTGNILLIANK